MKTICAWCGAVIKTGTSASNGLVSHGICRECAARTKADYFAAHLEKNRENPPLSSTRHADVLQKAPVYR